MAKEPRWANEPPPGFGPGGRSLIVPPGKKVKWPEPTIIGPNGESYSPDQWEAKKNADLDLDALSLEELEAMAEGLDESGGEGQ